jgi:hypothetical protein
MLEPNADHAAFALLLTLATVAVVGRARAR